MAARINPWRFYVYQLDDESGNPQYVGKGSGNRIKASIRERGYPGFEVARFKSERDAYQFEIDRIAEIRPALNKAVGGNGSWVTGVRAAKRLNKPDSFTVMCNKLGTRVVAARLFLAHYANAVLANLIEPVDKSELDQIRAVAYG